MTPSDILLFTSSSSGTGRDNNDKSNKIRESILFEGFYGRTESMFTDPLYGNDWRKLAEDFKTALNELGGSGPITLKSKGGRTFNYDFLVKRDDCEHKVEFKFGGTSVQTLPEFFNPAANKPFHDELYANMFYDEHLTAITTLYGLVPPPKTDYIKEIYKNKSSHPFFTELKDAEKSHMELYSQKRTLVAASIKAYLEKVKDTTKLDALTSEFMRSQSGKRFLIYNEGKFYHDRISDAELTAKSVVGVRNGNILVIQSEQPNTTHEMLLRWKNHLGVLFPAWQISMRRLAR